MREDLDISQMLDARFEDSQGHNGRRGTKINGKDPLADAIDRQ